MKLINQAEKAMRALGRKQSKIIKKRVVELAKELNKSGVVKLTGLVMGNGSLGWYGEVIMTEEGCEDFKNEPESFFEWAENPDFRYAVPKGATSKHAAMGREINAYLEWLTESQFVDIFDIKEEELTS